MEYTGVKSFFSTQPDLGRKTFPGRAVRTGWRALGEPNLQTMPLELQARIKMFPEGEKQRSLSRASSVATYDGSEQDFEWNDIADEVDTEELKRDREEVANWLVCSDPQPWHSDRAQDTMVAPFSLPQPHVPGSFFFQLLFALLAHFNFISTAKQYFMPIPTRIQKPDDPDEKPDPWILDVDDAMLCVVAPLRHVLPRPYPIQVTRDISWNNMKYQPKDSVRIYRVHERNEEFRNRVKSLGFHQVTDIRRPVDEFDCLFLFRHGHRSMDIGPEDEQWHMVSANRGLLQSLSGRIRRHQIPFRQRLIRFLRKLWPWRKDKRTWVKKNRFYALWGPSA